MNRMKLAQECVAIDEAGGNVREYLASKGFISPWGTWYRLQIEELGRSKNQITEGKGDASMSKITLEQKKKAVEMAIRGESPLPYLKKCGSTAPDKTWWYIKNKLKDADPELYAKIPDMRKVETEEPKPATCCAPSTRKGVEVPDEIPDAPKTLDGSAWEKYAVPAEEARPGIGADVKQAIRTAVPEEKPNVQLTVKSKDLKAVMEAPVSDAKDVRPCITGKLTKEMAEHQNIGRPLDKLWIKVYGLATPFGEFQTAGGMLAWYKNGNIIANRKIEDWKHLMETLPVVMEIMNI